MHDALIGELTTLIIQYSDPDKLMSEHRHLHGGHCACSTPNVPRNWPCTTYKVAARARELVMASRAPEMRVAG